MTTILLDILNNIYKQECNGLPDDLPNKCYVPTRIFDIQDKRTVDT